MLPLRVGKLEEEMTELRRLRDKWGAGKGDDVILMADFYHLLLSGQRDSVRKVLEVGIGHSSCMGEGYRFGASLFMWEEYFPNAEVYALDVRPEVMVNQGRIRSFVCDQGSEASLRAVMPLLGDGFDLIIDDGSHDPAHQVLTAGMFVPLLGPRGLYVIEDLWLEAAPWIRAGIPYRHNIKDFIDAEGKVGERMLMIDMEGQ